MTNKKFWDEMIDLSQGLFKTYVTVSRISDNEMDYCFTSNTNISKKLNKYKKSISRDIYSRCELEAEQGYIKNLNVILVLAIEGTWNFQARRNSISKVLVNKKAILEK